MDNSSSSDSGKPSQKNLSKKKPDKYQEGPHLLSISDFNKIYDKTIMKGFDYQAYIPKVIEPYQDNYSFKVYGFSFSQSSGTPTFTKNEEDNIIISLKRRKIGDYLEWDPSHYCNDFKVLIFRICQYIKQNYNLDFTDYEILEYYRVCRMNKGLFLNTIHSDESPFLEFVRSKRAKMVK